MKLKLTVGGDITFSMSIMYALHRSSPSRRFQDSFFTQTDCRRDAVTRSSKVPKASQRDPSAMNALEPRYPPEAETEDCQTRASPGPDKPSHTKNEDFTGRSVAASCIHFVPCMQPLHHGAHQTEQTGLGLTIGSQRISCDYQIALPGFQFHAILREHRGCAFA